MNSLFYAHEIAAAVNRRDVSAREMAETAIDAIRWNDPALSAFTDITAGRALAEADDVDRRIAAGEVLPLAGVPFAAKNLFDIAGLVTRAGSKINRETPAAASDATAVARLAEAGGLLLGATNMGEYAYDFTGQNAHDGASRNPHDPSRMSGGSSGGSATAVASGMVPLALGTDTNGSIRVPASFCGIYGLKPTYGRLSRAGAFPFVASFDHVGLLARSARDLAVGFDAAQGPDRSDPVQSDRPSLPTVETLSRGVEGLRIAVATGYFRQDAHPHANAAVDAVARLLSVGREIDVPEAARARAAAFLITNAEAGALHLKRLRSRAADYDPGTRGRFLSGAIAHAAWPLAAQRFRSWFRDSMARLFEDVDILLAPATPFPAPMLGGEPDSAPGAARPVLSSIGLFTQPISFVGLPVAVVPVWLPEHDLPIGVQLIAAAWREDLVLRLAHHLGQFPICMARPPQAQQLAAASALRPRALEAADNDR